MSKKQMSALIKLEEVMLFIFSIVLFAALNVKWWIFIAFLFVPDLSMLG